MARRKKGNRVHGWVFLDKPLGMGSTQAVSMVRRAFNAQKAGHAGTLDPLATGLLAIALGEATKTVPYMTDAQKTYTFTVRWGEATETCDAEGEVCATSPRRPIRREITDVLPDLTGQIEQAPPAYSAIKIDGQRAYDLARAGEQVEMAKRPVQVESLKLTGCPDEDHAGFEVCCGKGTYVRSLARDMAVALGTQGHVTALRRIATGGVSIDQCVAAGAFDDADADDLSGLLHPLEAVLGHLPVIELEEVAASKVAHGNPVQVAKHTIAGDQFCNGAELLLTRSGTPMAIARYMDGALQPVRVFQLDD
ncbi:tRNA pseudouridine(55) synthase TruB [Anderseniella sp. Alg231-50]|uniref:tRNA pseudouridine(55) synthase TruB n=1 Tax=Anderseniella sp. Alg231-50 TaxID=1922226 RepID=UPI000D562C09